MQSERIVKMLNELTTAFANLSCTDIDVEDLENLKVVSEQLNYIANTVQITQQKLNDYIQSRS
ncbi:hypothetical protein [Lysinibacillus piscis]|uniref:DUF1657 domain-containing protein n=1 Tax=Lysinibacillus piscis TaxID=2518931 RepID=A0ABQ5NMK9_9BACI|nr:hypothetical protein [Lysinibacillus sp. KH24]GLC89346.1 hypothetical protein LYSBPC_24730 [Lysinibacillus sp. KH24]